MTALCGACARRGPERSISPAGRRYRDVDRPAGQFHDRANICRRRMAHRGAVAGRNGGAARFGSARLASLNRLETEAPLIRLTPLAIRALLVEGLVKRAAEFAESAAAAANPERVVALSASAGLLTDELGLQTIVESEQSLGNDDFNKGRESGRMARDPAV